jgi:RNA polymerase subunit RPABC4/transcription elongation factor Spt4
MTLNTFAILHGLRLDEVDDRVPLTTMIEKAWQSHLTADDRFNLERILWDGWADSSRAANHRGFTPGTHWPVTRDLQRVIFQKCAGILLVRFKTNSVTDLAVICRQQGWTTPPPPQKKEPPTKWYGVIGQAPSRPPEQVGQPPRFCWQCGKSVAETARFCAKCGKPKSEPWTQTIEIATLEVYASADPPISLPRCSGCNRLVVPMYRYCPDCGKVAPKVEPERRPYCPKCKRVCSENERYCPNCGVAVKKHSERGKFDRLFRRKQD